jgi:hypothetical protein
MTRRITAGLTLAGVLLAACESIIPPKEVPNWDMTWDIPVKSTTITSKSLLPGTAVTVNDPPTFFFIATTQVSDAKVLDDVCTQCAAAPSGTSIPKPAFSATASKTVSVASGVNSAVLSGDTLFLTITNNLSFDPINPVGGAAGSIAITVKSGTTTIGSDNVAGGTTTLAASGGTLTRKIPLSGTVTSAGITVDAVLTSPAGTGSITITRPQSLVVTAIAGTSNAGSVRISSANVTLTGTTPTVNNSSLIDLSDIDESLSKRVQSGTMTLKITNPFAVSGSLTVTFTSTAGSFTKTITLPANATGTEQAITLSKDELQKLLNHEVTVTYSGTVAGTAAIEPASVVTFGTRMRLTLNTQADK